MKLRKWEVIMITIFLIDACSTTEYEERPSPNEEHDKKIIPSKTFNQFNHEWNY